MKITGHEERDLGGIVPKQERMAFHRGVIFHELQDLYPAWPLCFTV